MKARRASSEGYIRRTQLTNECEVMNEWDRGMMVICSDPQRPRITCFYFADATTTAMLLFCLLFGLHQLCMYDGEREPIGHILKS